MKFSLLVTSLFLFSIGISLGQSRQQDRDHPSTTKGDDYSGRYEYRMSKSNKKVKKRKSRKSEITAYYDQKIVEFKERMEAASKRYRKMEKEMKKPQYSDPTYFGHKKPPKKRPPGKKKFCKICGIRH